MKPEFVFGFENAQWPVLLLDEDGRVLRTNEAAVKRFGTVLEGAGPQLSAIWSAENTTTAEKFISHWLRSPTPLNRLKLLIRGGGTQAVCITLCSTSLLGEKLILMQMPPETEAAPSDPRTSSGGDATVAHKQKLDCALQLARTVALDFNNALTSILGHSSFLLSQTEPGAPRRNSLVEIEKAAGKAAEIANDLATFSRQEQEAHAPAAGNLNLVLLTAMNLFRSGYLNSPQRSVTWESRLDRELHAVRFNEAQLQQAAVRILENAVEAIESSGRITVSTRNLETVAPFEDKGISLPPGRYVCIEIADDGVGIPPQVLPRIFEPFFSTKGGTHRGLGLAWVYGIVTNHGGAVSVSSEPGRGTQVRTYLPAEAGVLGDAGTEAGELGGKETILMVDDEELLLTMGETILGAYGYRVLTANNGSQALEILDAMSPIDLVITDMVMPQMSGRELVERIRQVAPRTRILCTSGYVRPSGQGDKSGFLQKPFSCQELLLKVKQILSESAT